MATFSIAVHMDLQKTTKNAVVYMRFQAPETLLLCKQTAKTQQKLTFFGWNHCCGNRALDIFTHVFYFKSIITKHFYTSFFKNTLAPVVNMWFSVLLVVLSEKTHILFSLVHARVTQWQNIWLFWSSLSYAFCTKTSKSLPDGGPWDKIKWRSMA